MTYNTTLIMANLQEKDRKINAQEVDPYSSSDEGDSVEQPSSQEFSTLKGKKLDFNYGAFPWRDVAIQDTNSNKVEYFADVPGYTRNSPDVTLHARDGDGPVVGQARFRWSRSIKCGLGSNELSMDWVEINRSGALHKKFQFQYEGRVYSLLRTRDAEHGAGGLNGILMTHYKIVEEASGEVVAYYASQSAPGRRKGTLTFKDAVSQNLEALVVLTVVSVREKGRRRSLYSAGGGGAVGA